MANRPKQNRAEQSDAPNMKMIEPAQGGIHATVGHPVTQSGEQPQQAPHNQAGQNPRT